MRSALHEYVECGALDAGTTLYYALCNDFKATTCMAGDDVAPVLRELAVSLSCYVPSACHGSVAAVHAWSAQGGLAGLVQPAQAAPGATGPAALARAV
jgi:hypothetical protein